MEHDEELMEPDSKIRFIVPDSQFSDDSLQDLGQLPALKPQPLCVDKKSLPSPEGISSDTTMSERQSKPYFHFSSTTESEVEQGIPLAFDTVTDIMKQSKSADPRDSKNIKVMKKVFRKWIPPKMEADTFSSTDDANNPNLSIKHPESRLQSVRERKRKTRKTVHKKAEKNQHTLLVTLEQRQEQDNHQQLPAAVVSEPTQVISLQKKIQFNKPFDPDTSKAGPSTSRQDSSTHETQQLKNEGHTKSGDSTIQSKKITTSTEVAAELSSSSEHGMERTTVKRIDTVIIIVTEETITDLLSSKGTLIRWSENTVEVERKVLSSVASEKVTERVIIPELSPSRSVSTIPTGDLADISSLSLSRINSADTGRLPQEDECRQDSDLPGAVTVLLSVDQPKRHSASSSASKDLFSTPDQSIIDHADSEIGKVFSSSNSSPCSRNLISPSTAIRKPDDEGKTKFTTAANTGGQGTSTYDVAPSAELLVNSDVRSPVSTSVHDQPMQAGDSEGSTAVHGRNTPAAKVNYGPRHGETSGKQDVHNIRGKRAVRPDSGGDEQSVADSKSSKSISKKRKMSDAETSNTTPQQQKIKTSAKTQAEKAREDMEESSDVQSTGFSVHGGPPLASGGSLKDPALTDDPGVDVVVSDSSCPVTVVRRCQQLEVPLVSSEWVAQCLINGHLVDVKGHEKYKHDFLP